MILGADYVKNEKLLTICITDNIDGYMRVIEVKNIEDVISEKQAVKFCNQLYKRFNCDKMILEDNLRM